MNEFVSVDFVLSLLEIDRKHYIEWKHEAWHLSRLFSTPELAAEEVGKVFAYSIAISGLRATMRIIRESSGRPANGLPAPTSELGPIKRKYLEDRNNETEKIL